MTTIGWMGVWVPYCITEGESQSLVVIQKFDLPCPNCCKLGWSPCSLTCMQLVNLFPALCVHNWIDFWHQPHPKHVMESSCFDCHSWHTPWVEEVWPWLLQECPHWCGAPRHDFLLGSCLGCQGRSSSSGAWQLTRNESKRQYKQWVCTDETIQRRESVELHKHNNDKQKMNDRKRRQMNLQRGAGGLKFH